MQCEIIKEYINRPTSLISFMEKSTGLWGIKSTDSRWIYANDESKKFHNIEKSFDIEGRLDKEIPMPSQELWEEFVKTDRRCIKENKTLSTIEIHHYGKGNTSTPVPALYTLTPLLNTENQCIGIVCHGKQIDAPELLYYMDRLNRPTIEFDAPHNHFTKKELEVAFWAQQKLSSKEIAKRLNVSHRTVENRFFMIYQKANVNNLNQFIEYCKSTGLDRYIPVDFIRKGVQLLA